MKKVPGLVLRGGWWHVDVHINGQRIRKSLGIPVECSQEANAAMSAFWLEIGKGNLNIGEYNPPLAKLFDSYIKARGDSISPKWRKQCEGYFKRVVENLHLVFFNDFNALEFKNWLLSMDTRRTAREIQILIRAVFEEAFTDGTVSSNPLERMKLIRHKKKERIPLTEEEFIQFARHTEGYTCQNLLLFLMKTGCRFSEAALARRRQVDLHQQIFTLDADQTKTSRGRKVGLTDDLCIMLENILADEADPTSYVFTNSLGNTFTSYNVRRIVKRIGQKIGRPDITTYTLRHTFVTLCREKEDVSLIDIGKEVGHSSQHTTKIYDHPTPARQRKVAAKLPTLHFLFKRASG